MGVAIEKVEIMPERHYAPSQTFSQGEPQIGW